ncbi:hypothetical protein [Pseudanabaena sp. ABRG5-3]|uniref:hypothetical protein n=1 Tax=Pseudanabaena sp. ABRG5-3 TaxID=685565 RepID=UPI000DC727A8|nr:hypothetical protein [Pseudanabaena sp. ABRG5-3]BBC25118.1 hypothetical protein ABRG53_2861 [Pseudanabaena sp. ABRG5-3]
MPKSIFSQYKQGENRVTASILAVFEKISFRLVEKILQILFEDTNQSVLTFKNQVKHKDSVPDARIHASFTYLLETKVVPILNNSAAQEQLRNHIKVLEGESTKHKRLLVLTPDREFPEIITEVIKQTGSDLIRWSSFNALYEAIREVTASNILSEERTSWLESDLPMVTEQERFLLRELVQMLFAERLIGTDYGDSVLVVAARGAIKEYRDFSVYLCQPNRTFRSVPYIAFYHRGKIDRHIAKILEKPIEEVVLNQEGIESVTDLTYETKQKLFKLIEKMEEKSSPRFKDNLPYKVFFLSEPNDQTKTIILDHDIKNDLVNESGQSFPFTYGQRYVSLEAFKRNPKTTTKLLRG